MSTAGGMAELRAGGPRCGGMGSEASVTTQCWPQVLLLRVTDVSQEALYAPLERAGRAGLGIFIVSITNSILHPQ